MSASMKPYVGRSAASLALAVWLVVLSGCALLPGREPRGWTIDDANDEIVLEIRNDNANDARIYILWN